MSVINRSKEIVKAFARECKATGLKDATKELNGFQRARLNSGCERLFGENCSNGLYSVENYKYITCASGTKDTMVTARDIYRKSSILGRIKEFYSQLMSTTGEAHIFPAKKGFLGIGKKKGYLEVSQYDRAKTFTDRDVEHMWIRANGTLEAPTNPILYVGDGKAQKQVMLTMDKAKEFIQKVLKGEEVSSISYIS